MTDQFRLSDSSQLRYTRGPYSYEYIHGRPKGTQWRIKDRDDNACGSAPDEDGAIAGCRILNGQREPMSDLNAVGALIRQRRRNLRISLRDLSARSGVSIAAISSFENGNSDMASGRVLAISNALNLRWIVKAEGKSHN